MAARTLGSLDAAAIFAASALMGESAARTAALR